MAPIRPGAGPPPRRLLRGGERLQHLVGTRLLVGVTVRDVTGAVLSRTQFCGPVLEVADGVVVVDKDGEQALLPSDDLAYSPAPKGRYTLTGTGEVVVDPDFVTTWDVVAEPGADVPETTPEWEPDPEPEPEPAPGSGPGPEPAPEPETASVSESVSDAAPGHEPGSAPDGDGDGAVAEP